MTKTLVVCDKSNIYVLPVSNIHNSSKVQISSVQYEITSVGQRLQFSDVSLKHALVKVGLGQGG